MQSKSFTTDLLKILKTIVLFQFAVVAIILFKIFLLDVPSLSVGIPKKTVFMDVKGDDSLQYKWVALSHISSNLARAVVASEDGRFYEHNGIDLDELEKSWKRDAKKNKFVRGGSTIPMQLAKNIFLTPNKNLFRKGLEMLLACEMDLVLPKERMLELYLNVIEWGPDIFGAEAAAEYYFHKSAENLTSYEAAYLAAIIPNPKNWGQIPPGPFVRRRVATILERMTDAPFPDLENIAYELDTTKPPADISVTHKENTVPRKTTPVSPVSATKNEPKEHHATTLSQQQTQTPATVDTTQSAAMTETQEPENFFLDDD